MGFGRGLRFSGLSIRTVRDELDCCCLLREHKPCPDETMECKFSTNGVANVGAIIIRIGFWGYYTIIIRRNPPKSYSNY